MAVDLYAHTHTHANKLLRTMLFCKIYFSLWITVKNTERLQMSIVDRSIYGNYIGLLLALEPPFIS